MSFKKTDFNRHLLTSKHLRLQNTTNDYEKNEILEIKKFACECGKKYKHHSSLWSHKKKCDFINNNNKLSIINENTIVDELKNIIIKQQTQISKQQEQLSELLPKIGNNITNNTQNNKFNINVFLNEKCKDAINMTDFVKSIEVSLQQLDFTKQNGLAHGLSKTIMDNINKLSLYERPLHCTDIKRETLYIKENDNWEKDNDKVILKKAIKDVSKKQFSSIKKWTDENPDFQDDDTKQEYFAKVLSVLGKDISTVDDKIIKKICNHSHVKNLIDK